MSDVRNYKVIEKFYESASNRSLGLMVDLDGATLHRKPAIHNPVEADLDYDAALRTLADYGCPVAINTGRPEMFVNNVFPRLVQQKDRPIYIATETGAKIVGPNRELMSSKALPEIERLRQIFAAKAVGYEGAIVEEYKMCAITISLKHCSDHIRRDAFDQMVVTAEEIKRIDSKINSIPVWKENDVYIEIVPNDVDKGTAAIHILDQEAFSGKITFCFGDSKADEPMMSIVRNRGGFAIGVGKYLEKHVQDINFDDHHESQIHIQRAAKLASGEMGLQQAIDMLNGPYRLAL